MARRSFGWIGIVIVAVGAAVAALGIWYFVSNHPTPGAVIYELAINADTKLVIRAEEGGPRSFVELRHKDKVKWRALVPPYAGRKGVPAVAWNDNAVSVRVIRGEKGDPRAEIFAVAMRDASKLGGIKLAENHGAIKLDAPGPITVTDHVRSYELVAGEGWNQLTAVDLKIGTVLWQRELDAAPVEAARVEGGTIVVTQAGKKRWFNVFTGKEDRTFEKVGIPPFSPL
ncbi:MAG: hypothetical protein SFX73_14930 [Kofleriaceae bacterium]|nr:hypothetical protein [Kofleriaceae bacterium]